MSSPNGLILRSGVQTYSLKGVYLIRSMSQVIMIKTSRLHIASVFGIFCFLLVIIPKMSQKKMTFPLNDSRNLSNRIVTEASFWENYYNRLIREMKIEQYKLTTSKNCPGHFFDQMEDNMNKVVCNPVTDRVKEKYTDIFHHFKQHVVAGNEMFPVIVTGASSNHFNESVRMIKSLKKNIISHYKGMKLIFYDLGLSQSQVEKIQVVCNCEIRTFPFQKYPRFVSNLVNYVWKPIIIYTMLKEYNFVTWADSSLLFFGNKKSTDMFFKTAKEVGILMKLLGECCPSNYFTKEETFKFLNEAPCLFEQSQFGGGEFVTIWKTNFTWKYIVQPWLACALTENCMSDPDPLKVVNCNRRNNGVHHCHRFDQSVISIIIQRLFNVNYSLVSMNRLPQIHQVNQT